MAAQDKYKIVVNANFATNWYQNSLAFNWIGTGDPTAVQIAALADAIKELFRPSQASTLNYYDWNAYQLWGSGMAISAGTCTRTGGRIFSGLLSSPLPGGGTGSDALPPQCSLVTTLTTGIAGRRKRGRLFTTGYAETMQAGGVWDTSLLTIQQTRWNTFLGTYGSGGSSTLWSLGVWSERTASGCIPNPSGHGHINVDTPDPANAFTVVSGVTLRSVVYNQRRRTLGVGR